jgi:hypothetical protein
MFLYGPAAYLALNDPVCEVVGVVEVGVEDFGGYWPLMFGQFGGNGKSAGREGEGEYL